MKYKIAHADKIDEIIIQVEDYIEKGYVPLGSIVVGDENTNWNYFQSMILIESKADEIKLKNIRTLVIS